MSKRLRASMRAANKGRNLRPRSSLLPSEPGDRPSLDSIDERDSILDAEMPADAVAFKSVDETSTMTTLRPNEIEEREAEEEARREAEAQAQREAEEEAQREAEAQAQREAEEEARREAEAQAKREAEEEARRAAAAQAKREAEEKARREADAKAKQEADAKAKREADAKTKQEAEAKARRDAEAKAKLEAEAKAKVKREGDAKAKQEAEAKAKREADAKAKLEAEAKAKREAEAKAKARAEEQKKAESSVSLKKGIPAKVDEKKNVKLDKPVAKVRDDEPAKRSVSFEDEHEADPSSVSAEFFRKDEDSVPPVEEVDEAGHPFVVLSPHTLARRARLRRLVAGVVAFAGVMSIAVVGKTLAASKRTTSTVVETKRETVKPPQSTAAVKPAPVAEAPKPEPAKVDPPKVEEKKAEEKKAEEPAKVEEKKAEEKKAEEKKAEEPAKAPSGGDAVALTKETEALLNRGKRKEAMDKAREAIAADPTQAMPYLLLGSALQDSGKWKDGIEQYSECVRHATKGPVHECRAMGGKK